MALNWSTTKDAALNGAKILIYGPAGVGKTSLARSVADRAVILSAESGLLPLKDLDIPVIKVTSYEELREAYVWLADPNNEDAKKYTVIILDSITEIGDIVLDNAMDETKHGPKAYGDTLKTMLKMIKSFRDLPGKDVVLIASESEKQSDTGAFHKAPMFPGKTLEDKVPYLLDCIFKMGIDIDEEGKRSRHFMVESDGTFKAKDRSGLLSHSGSKIVADLGAVLDVIRGKSK